jgi:hypothetical protein
MSKPALTALYFVLTFFAGVAVGSWALWIYLIGFPSKEALPEPATPPPIVAAPAPAPEPSAPSPAPAETREEPAASPPPAPMPKGHWETVDAPPRSHEECLALTKELNDAYKDCRFGVHKEVWVAE